MIFHRYIKPLGSKITNKQITPPRIMFIAAKTMLPPMEGNASETNGPIVVTSSLITLIKNTPTSAPTIDQDPPTIIMATNQTELNKLN